MPDGTLEMSTDDPTSLLDEWAAAWTAGDVQRLLELFTDDCIYEDVGMGSINTGKEQIRNLEGGALLAGSRNVEVVLTACFVSGEYGAMEWRASGSRDAEIPGVSRDGRGFQIRGASVVQFRDGKISRCADYWDFYSLMRSLGRTD
jgi:steroid delta-isomerase-like uncharacterized protein